MTRGAAGTVPSSGERRDGSKTGSTPTLMDSTLTLKKKDGNTFYGITGKNRRFL